MGSPEEAALLRLEEVFLVTLARIDSLILKPLLFDGESKCLGVGQGRGHRCGPSDKSPTVLDPLSHSFLSQVGVVTLVLPAPSCWLLPSQRTLRGTDWRQSPASLLILLPPEAPRLAGRTPGFPSICGLTCE
jgi:hypothetical protein